MVKLNLRLCAIIVLHMALTFFGLSRAAAWEVPTGVVHSDVVVGYLYAESALAEPANYLALLSGVEVTVADLDGNGTLTIPTGQIFLAGTRSKDILVSEMTTMLGMQAAGTFTNDQVVAAGSAQQAQLVQTLKAAGPTYNTDAHLYADFTTAHQMALDARPADAFLINVMVPTGPMLVTQDDLDVYAQNAVTSGGSLYGLQPDDTGLAQVLATVPTTYNPTATDNAAPTADAGADQTVASEGSVTLDGTASNDPDVGDTLSYAWTQTGGTPVTLSDATAAQPSFTAPTLASTDAAEVLTFSLVVTDSNATTSVADTVEVTVNPPTDTTITDPTFNCDVPTGPDQGEPGADQSFDVKVGDVITLTTYFCRTALRSNLTSASTVEVNGNLLQYGQPTLNGANVDYSGDPWTSPSDSFVITINDATSFSFQVQDFNYQDYITISFNVTQDPTTTTLAASTTTATFGDTVTLTATVDPSDATGAVTFWNAGSYLGSSDLEAGAARLDVSELPVGAQTITAEYSGAGPYLGSTSAGVDVTIDAVDGPTDTDPTFNCDVPTGPDQGQPGADQSFDVKVGDVITLTTYFCRTALRSNLTSASTVEVNGNLLQYGQPTLNGANVDYSGDPWTSPSDSFVITINDATSFSFQVQDFNYQDYITISFNVTQDPTTTTLAASATTATFGDTVTLTATVEPSDATGAVTFWDVGNVLGTATIDAGVASLEVFDLLVGAHGIMAEYGGDAAYLGSTSASVDVTIDPAPNTAPTADAGVDQSVASEELVTLDGTASSDPDLGDSLTYAWTQTGGTPVDLSDATAAQPSFTAPVLTLADVAETLTFALEVTDSNASTSLADEVEITVNPPVNTAPTADAGVDQSVASEALVTLDGTASYDPDLGDSLTYAWTQTGGTSVDLSDATAAQPSFTAPTLTVADAAETLTFALEVTDSNATTSLADTVEITVNPPVNALPTADAGELQVVLPSEVVTLDGRGSSDPDADDTLSYVWTQTGGIPVELSDPTAAQPTFTAPVLRPFDPTEEITFTLVVIDSFSGVSVACPVIIIVEPPIPVYEAPTADAGADQSVASEALVTLHGSATTDPYAGETIGYAWTQTGGRAVVLSDATADQPTFTAPTLAVTDAAEVLSFALVVTDANDITSVADEVEITVNPPVNALPTADAGELQVVLPREIVTLDGRGSSDPDANDTLSYVWTQTGGIPVELSDPTAAQPTFTAPVLRPFDPTEEITFTLVVIDRNSGVSVACPVIIIVEPPVPVYEAPTADAGADQSVASEVLVTLHGSGTTSPFAGKTIGYAWTQTGGRAVVLSDAMADQPTFTAPTLAVTDAAEVLSFALVVTDANTIASLPDTVEITVNPPAPTPATAFAQDETVLRDLVTEQAGRSLQATLSADQRLIRDARQRFIADRLAPGDSVPLDVDGTLDASGATLSSKGSFFAAQAGQDGQRHLLFGDFDIQRDDQTSSRTMTLSGKIAWETPLSDKTLWGYFAGGDLASSSIAGLYRGSQDSLALSLGAYAVHEVADQVFVDGFVTLGAGKNTLDISNTTLALAGDYLTPFATLGGAVSGVIHRSGYEIWPELAVSYGKTWIGAVGVEGRAYGLTDSSLTLQAGPVTVANIVFRPELRVPFDGLTGADSLKMLTLTPRYSCARITAGTTREDCGFGAEMGLRHRSDDGLTSFTVNLLTDQLSGQQSTALSLTFDHRF